MAFDVLQIRTRLTKSAARVLSPHQIEDFGACLILWRCLLTDEVIGKTAGCITVRCALASDRLSKLLTCQIR
jgi:hypothetical protein